jgi:hypothetical protein
MLSNSTRNAMNTDDKRLQDTGTNSFYSELIHYWVLSDCDFKGNLTRFDIIILDPADNQRKTMTYDEFKKFDHSDPIYLNYDWHLLEFEIDKFRKVAIEGAQYKKAEHEKKTDNKVIYKNTHYYNETKVKGKMKPNEEKGVIMEKTTVDVDRRTKTPIKSTERLIETFYFFGWMSDEDPPRKLWVYKDVLDDLIKRDIKDMRIVSSEGLFYVDTSVFSTYGTIDKKKVYIDLDASTFDVYPNGEDFDVDVRDSDGPTST